MSFGVSQRSLPDIARIMGPINLSPYGLTFTEARAAFVRERLRVDPTTGADLCGPVASSTSPSAAPIPVGSPSAALPSSSTTSFSSSSPTAPPPDMPASFASVRADLECIERAHAHLLAMLLLPEVEPPASRAPGGHALPPSLAGRHYPTPLFLHWLRATIYRSAFHSAEGWVTLMLRRLACHRLQPGGYTHLPRTHPTTLVFVFRVGYLISRNRGLNNRMVSTPTPATSDPSSLANIFFALLRLCVPLLAPPGDDAFLSSEHDAAMAHPFLLHRGPCPCFFPRFPSSVPPKRSKRVAAAGISGKRYIVVHQDSELLKTKSPPVGGEP